MSQNNILRDFAKYSSLSVLGMLAMSCYILAVSYTHLTLPTKLEV